MKLLCHQLIKIYPKFFLGLYFPQSVNFNNVSFSILAWLSTISASISSEDIYNVIAFGFIKLITRNVRLSFYLPPRTRLAEKQPKSSLTGRNSKTV